MDEDGAGLDSLARLDLVKEISTRFSLPLTGVDDYLLVHRTLGEWADLLTEHFRRLPPSAELVFFTSGTTGPAKAVRHSLSRLLAEVDALWGTVIGSDASRVVTLVPPHHIYGFLFTVLLPSRADLPVKDLTDVVPGAALRRSCTGDLVVATPHLWNLALGTDTALPPGVTGLTSTEPASSDLWSRARMAGLDGLIEIYGASETAGVGSRRSGEAPFTLLPHLSRDGEGVRSGERALELQDHLTWRCPRSFSLAGRRDAAVQVAGHNVRPKAVAASLSQTAGVAAIRVGMEQDRLTAEVVPTETAGPLQSLEQRLREAAAAQLPPEARPRVYRFSASFS